jgi:acyl-CoA thioesterase I
MIIDEMEMKSGILGWLLLMLMVNSEDNQKKFAIHLPAKSCIQKKMTALPAKKNIVFFGNSLTAGYGLDPPEAFPSLIQARIDSLHLAYKVINAGVSGETSADGLSRIDWILRQPISIFVLELGGNDGLRGLPADATYKNLNAIIERVKVKFPDARIIIAGIQVPPNMGDSYAVKFRAIFPQLAKKNKVLLLPFILEGVGGIPKLNQKDGIHPNAEGEKIVAENVWRLLRDIL